MLSFETGICPKKSQPLRFENNSSLSMFIHYDALLSMFIPVDPCLSMFIHCLSHLVSWAYSYSLVAITSLWVKPRRYYHEAMTFPALNLQWTPVAVKAPHSETNWIVLEVRDTKIHSQYHKGNSWEYTQTIPNWLLIFADDRICCIRMWLEDVTNRYVSIELGWIWSVVMFGIAWYVSDFQ